MKKTIALFGTLLIFAGTRSKAQTPQQVPVKKETTKPASGTSAKALPVDTVLKLGSAKGSTTTSGAKSTNPTFGKTVNPTFTKGASSSTNQSVESRHVPTPPNQSVDPRHKG